MLWQEKRVLTVVNKPFSKHLVVENAVNVATKWLYQLTKEKEDAGKNVLIVVN